MEKLFYAIVDFTVNAISRHIVFLGNAEKEVVREAVETLFLGIIVALGLIGLFLAPYYLLTL